MNRKITVRLFCLALSALLLIPCLTMCAGQEGRATLVVGGKTVERAEAYIYGEYPVIPLLATLEACGYDVSRTSSDTAVVTIDTIRYTVSLTDLTMYEEGKEENLLYVPEDAYEYTCKATKKDILIYCYRLKANLSEHTNIQFDYSKDIKNAIIYVDIKVVVDT